MILIIDDDIAVRTSLELLLNDNGFETLTAGTAEDAMKVVSNEELSLIVLDLNFSIETSGREGMQLLTDIRKADVNVPVVLITGWGSIDLAVEGMRLGASDFITKPWSNDHLLQSVRTHIKLKEQPRTTSSRKDLDSLYDLKQIVGADEKMLELLETAGRVASTDASVLIMGESGTGKELIAEAIHRNSGRAAKPFVKVNLGGISTSLFESEMFGHVRGAFTDARTDRVGRFELANKGTIFLDEIGDLDPASQVKLLRVLQDRTFEVLGSSRTKTVDVRVVSATNRALQEMVAKGSFREDLLYRINLITLHVPPLRERPSDIPALVNFFADNLKVIYNRPNLSLKPEVHKWLRKLNLPGNIRQLKNLVERTVLVSRNDELTIADFEKHLELSPGKNGSVQLPDVGSLTLEQLEVMMIRKALEFHKRKVSRAAASLGLTRSALYRRLEKYGIPYDEDSD
ncbi:MAG: sigma-54 dependent transcriptional regulator [Flavitalea sp.]